MIVKFSKSAGTEESQKRNPSIEKRGKKEEKKERKRNEPIAEPKYHKILIVP